MNSQLQRIIELARKTGDRIIVFDPQKSSDAYILMPVDDYEKIVSSHKGVRGLTEDELLDKINRDIGVWKSDSPEHNFLDNEAKNSENDYDMSEDDWYDGESLENISENDFQDNWHSIKDVEEKTKEQRKVWNIPKERKAKAEEVIEEDMFYLENVD